MAEEITIYEGIKEKLRNKIKEQFVELIPEAEWDKMLADEFDKFTKGENCEMRRMMREEITKQMAAAINLEMGKSHYQMKWDNFGHEGAGQAVGKLIREHSQDLMTGLISGIVQEAVNQMRQSIQRGY